jgi:hypothetical protein
MEGEGYVLWIDDSKIAWRVIGEGENYIIRWSIGKLKIKNWVGEIQGYSLKWC